MRRRTSRLGAGVATLVLLAGCGGSSAPSDAVPALGTSLERIDDAIVEERYEDARRELDELVATTTAARDDGDLEGNEADQILAAAARVMSALPAEPEEEVEEPAPTDEPSPTETEAPPPAPEESAGEGDAEEESEEEAKEQEELEKEQEKLEEELQKEEEEAEKEAEKEAGKEEGSGNGEGN